LAFSNGFEFHTNTETSDTGDILWHQAHVSDALAVSRRWCYHFKGRYQTATEALQALQLLVNSQPCLLGSMLKLHARQQPSTLLNKSRNQPPRRSIAGLAQCRLRFFSLPCLKGKRMEPLSHSPTHFSSTHSPLLHPLETDLVRHHPSCLPPGSLVTPVRERAGAGEQRAGSREADPMNRSGLRLIAGTSILGNFNPKPGI